MLVALRVSKGLNGGSLLKAAREDLGENSLFLLRVVPLQIPQPFLVLATNTSLKEKDEGGQLAPAVLMVTNGCAHLGQVTPDISPASLKLQVLQRQIQHAKETRVGHTSKLGHGTAKKLAQCMDKGWPSLLGGFARVQQTCDGGGKFQHGSQVWVTLQAKSHECEWVQFVHQLAHDAVLVQALLYDSLDLPAFLRRIDSTGSFHRLHLARGALLVLPGMCSFVLKWSITSTLWLRLFERVPLGSSPVPYSASPPWWLMQPTAEEREK